MVKKVWTVTFGESAENHKGMQKLGNIKSEGYSYSDLKKVKTMAKELKYETLLVNLEKFLPKKYLDEDTDTSAYVLVVKNGIEMLLGSEKRFNKFYDEIKNLNSKVDKKAYMYGRVVNKTARYNLCFGEKSQEPDYENKKGRIVSFDELKYTNKIREILPSFIGKKGKNLLAELNYYYDIEQCGISDHSDLERRRVIGLRLGAKMPLYFRWYLNSKRISDRIKINLSGGDFYIMSEKAVGTDGRKKLIPILRHCTGAKKFTD